MGRNKKILLLIVIILALIGMLVMKDDTANVSVKIKKNKLVIDNFEMAKVVDDEQNFYKLNAELAELDRETRSADLTKFRLRYKKGDTDLYTTGDKGYMEDEVRIDASGNLKGTVNGFDFSTGAEGKFYYDFDTEIGTLNGNIIVKGDEGTILAEKAIIYQKDNILEFIGHVKVTFSK